MTPRSSTDVLAGSFSTAGSDAEGPVTDISKKQWLFFSFFFDWNQSFLYEAFRKVQLLSILGDSEGWKPLAVFWASLKVLWQQCWMPPSTVSIEETQFTENDNNNSNKKISCITKCKSQSSSNVHAYLSKAIYLVKYGPKTAFFRQLARLVFGWK